MTALSTDELIRTFYKQVWNRWNEAMAHSILAADFRFRGSLGTETTGVRGFLTYVDTIRNGFPDFRNTIDELLVDGNRAAARLTYRGTHEGKVLGFEPTGRTISYSGAAFFSTGNTQIDEAWVLGDVDALAKQLS